MIKIYPKNLMISLVSSTIMCGLAIYATWWVDDIATVVRLIISFCLITFLIPMTFGYIEIKDESLIVANALRRWKIKIDDISNIKNGLS